MTEEIRETLLTMFSHTGTHMDSPAHLFSQRTTLDSFSPEQFVGKGFVIDCSDLKEGERITMKYIEAVKEKADKAQFILFHTGWDKYWGTSSYFGKYPYIADENLTIHRKLLAKTDIVIIENLTCLDKVGDDLFTFCALPLKFKNSDGAPVRAIAILDDNKQNFNLI